MDIRVTGGERLEHLGAALKEAGRNDLRKELLRGVRTETRTLPPKIRASAETTLPRRGGLAANVAASRIAVRTRLAGRQIGVRVTGAGAAPLRRLNAGSVRHPTYGHPPWTTQPVRAGWFDHPIEADAIPVRQGIVAAIDRVGAKLEGAA